MLARGVGICWLVGLCFAIAFRVCIDGTGGDGGSMFICQIPKTLMEGIFGSDTLPC